MVSRSAFSLEGCDKSFGRSEVFDLDEMAIGHFYDPPPPGLVLLNGKDLIGP